MRGPVVKITAVMIMLLSLTMIAGCTDPEPAARLPGPETYPAADPLDEDSVAGPVPPGTASAVTEPLGRRGAFCTRVRGNADAVALWCRNRDADDPWPAQFLVDRQDRLAWAWFPVPAAADGYGADGEPVERYQPERLAELASASLGAAWPDSADRIVTEIRRYERDRWHRIERAVSSEGAFTRTWRDAHADYTVSSLHGLIVAARGVAVARWPSGAEHYAARMSAAVADLRQSGYECFYPPQTFCRREFDEFRVSLRGDRIITAEFMIKGDETLADTFPRGLTFLAPGVREEIAAQIERSRVGRSDFLGVVAGTLLAVDAAPVPPVGGTVPVRVRVGAPLAGTFPL